MTPVNTLAKAVDWLEMQISKPVDTPHFAWATRSACWLRRRIPIEFAEHWVENEIGTMSQRENLTT